MDTRAIARELLDALDRGKTIASVVERHPGFDWDEAYEVASDIVQLRRDRGEKTLDVSSIAWRIGHRLTNGVNVPAGTSLASHEIP